MSLLTRLVNPPDEQGISAHLFMAALAEMKRGAINLTQVGDTFGLSTQERIELATFASQVLGDIITREQVHDVLMLGRAGLYSESFCSTRLLTGSATNVLPLIVQKELEILLRGYNDFILVGCTTSAQGSPNMTLAMTKGAIMSGGVLKPVTAGNVTITAANASSPRIDIVVAASDGSKVVRAGTASPSPQPPALSGGDVALSFVYVPPAVTSIVSGYLLDCRILRTQGPITIGKVTSAAVANNTSAPITAFTLTIPDGLFLQGKTIRVRCGGTMLLNSGTPTVTMAITYGGTTMFQDVTGAATNDTDRLAWCMSFEIVAQANNDQALNGVFLLGPVGAKTAASTGTGDIAVPGVLAGIPVPAPINGGAAVDSNSADRALTLLFQMSVANAANEIVLEQGTAELV